MLGKLIKHEFKATYINYVFLYVALIIMTLINKLVWIINTDNNFITIIRGLITALYVILLVATIVVTVILIIYRFYKNLIKEEGYLSFTLPVGVGQHIFSKLIASFIWSILTVVVMIISALIMGINTELYSSFSDFWGQLSILIDSYDGVIRLIVEIIILLFLSSIYMILMFYASLSLGQLFAKHKFAGAILSFFGFYIITQIISSVISVSMLGDYADFYSGAYNVLGLQMIDMFNNIFLISIIFQIVFLIIYYVITYIVLSRKLNLE